MWVCVTSGRETTSGHLTLLARHDIGVWHDRGEGAVRQRRTAYTARARDVEMMPTLESPASGALALRRLLLAVAAAVLLGLTPFLSGLVGALMLYVMTRHLHERFERVVPSRVSAFTIVMCVVLLLLMPGAWLVSTIISEGSDFLRTWRPETTTAWLARTPLGAYDLSGEIANVVRSMATQIPHRAVVLVGSLTSTVLNVVVALFGLYYLLLGGNGLWRRIVPLIHGSERITDLLATRFATVTEALLLGTALAAVLQGAVVGLGFAIVGLHPPVLWGFITACVSILPLFGSALVWLPGVAVLLLDHRPGAALFLALLGGGLASNIDNIARLVVYRRVSGIHPMITLVGAFAGLRIFGVVGVFIGPLVISYFFELLAVYEETASDSAANQPDPLSR
jgi:predicted PurR-regulated permease PerM